MTATMSVTSLEPHTDSSTTGRDDLAHLLRRAGFTPRPDELDHAETIGYRAAVEHLLAPPPPDDEERYLTDRHLTASMAPMEAAMAAPAIMWQLVTSTNPLREKLALFWHGLFATAYKDGIAGVDQAAQFEMFRRHGLDRFDELLTRLSQDPAMLVYLDNQLSAVDRLNENYGRELLELFSMGRGTYDEDDVAASAAAFTGWSVRRGPSAFHLGARPMWFTYDADRHDDHPRRFLGATTSNGNDVIATIVEHPATARFVATCLYQYFVEHTPDEATVDHLATIFRRTGGDIRAMLRELLMSPRFLHPDVRRAKVVSPIELVVGLARIADTWDIPNRRLGDLVDAAALMGQRLLTPPNVAGWVHGEAWLQGSNLLERINYASAVVASSSILVGHAERLCRTLGVVDACLTAVDLDHLSDTSRGALTAAAEQLTDGRNERQPVGDLLTLVAALPEFQYC